MNNGWIKLHRKLLDWEWIDDTNTGWLFMVCLMSANHADNKWHGKIIKKGTFITSQPHLAKLVGLSVQQTRTSLNKLKSTGELTVKTNNKYSVISINKWSEYQSSNRQDNRLITGKQQTDNRLITTNNNIKNDKNIKNIESITEETIKTISTDYQVPREFVLSKIDDIKNYCASTGKVYRDYIATLRNWVKKDAIKLRMEVNKYGSKRGIDARNIE